MRESCFAQKLQQGSCQPDYGGYILPFRNCPRRINPIATQTAPATPSFMHPKLFLKRAVYSLFE